MIIVDAQQNIAFNAQQLGRDYTAWAWHQRHSESRSEAPPATTSLFDNLLGRVAIVFGSLQVVAESSPQLQPWQQISYRSASDARQLALWQLDYYRRLADESDRVQLIRTQEDLSAVLASWDADESLGQRLHGIVMLMKGADALAEPQQCEEWLEYGLRILAPAWQRNRYSDGYEGDFTLAGYELLEVMAGFNVLLDISGLSERASAAAIERYSRPGLRQPRQPAALSR